MFCAAVSLSYLVEPKPLESKVIELGRGYAGWSEAETRSRMHAVLSRAQAAADGETAEWLGQQLDPRYRLTNQRILAMLRITPAEEVHMETLISQETKRQRDRKRKELKRRAAGVRPREEYLDEARELRQQRRQAAKRLLGEGMSLRKIGKELGVSQTQVSRLLNADSPTEDLNDLN
jgi:Homeodomain-like domain